MSGQRAAVGWRIVEGSVVGPGHSKAGAPNQDGFGTEVLPSGATVAVVADGAGSRARSEVGAMLAVRSGIEAARSVFGTSLPTDAVGWRRACGCLRTTVLDNFDGNLSMRIEQDRRNEGLGREQIKLGDYASTLLAVVSAPPWLAYIAVGDCFLVVDRRPGGAFLLSPVAEVREHGGATVFMTSDSRQEHCSTGLVWDAGIRGIALATDGLYEALLTYRRDADDVLWYTAPKDFVRYFDHFASAGGDELASVLASDPFVKSSGDDKTMIIMVQE